MKIKFILNERKNSKLILDSSRFIVKILESFSIEQLIGQESVNKNKYGPFFSPDNIDFFDVYNYDSDKKTNKISFNFKYKNIKDLRFYFHLYIFHDKDPIKSKISAFATPHKKEKTLTIQLLISYLNFSDIKQIIRKFYPSIKESLAHELEHYSQFKHPDFDSLYGNDYEAINVNLVKYLSSNSEVEAYVVGLVKSAKIHKVPFEDELFYHFNKFWNIIIPEQVVKKYVDYYNYRYHKNLDYKIIWNKIQEYKNAD